MIVTEIFEKSVVVCAHPDDEVLWFSSILGEVDRVVICFLGIPSEPHRHAERQRSLSEHPLKRISCLGIDQSETFYGVNWDNPILTQYGIEISDKNYSDKKYKKNYYTLKEHLKNELAGVRNIFTHNPWGEYGSDEHIQIYRVIKELQKTLNFNIWFSNYVSNKSFKLMLEYLYKWNYQYIPLKTNKALAGQIKRVYTENNCWTWYDHWEWLDEESFMKDEISGEKSKDYGEIFPMNLIKVWLPLTSESRKEKTFFHSPVLNSIAYWARKIVNTLSKIKARIF